MISASETTTYFKHSNKSATNDLDFKMPFYNNGSCIIESVFIADYL